ncbi:hypothetical protein [Streptomyces sp. NPDC047841]
MQRVVQFTDRRQAEAAEPVGAEPSPDHLRVRTRYSCVSAGTRSF